MTDGNGLDPDSDEYKTKVKDVYKEIMNRYGEGTEYQPLVVNEIREMMARI